MVRLPGMVETTARIFLVLILVLTALSSRAEPVRTPGSGEAAGNSGLSFRPADSMNEPAFHDFTNMEYDRAAQEFTQILQRHPDDAFAINHLLMAVLFRELYRMGVLNTGEYSSNGFIGSAHKPIDAQVQQQIMDLMQRATAIEEQALRGNSNDVAALYCRGVTRAQESIFLGLVQHAWFSALRNAVGARRDHERVLALDPSQGQAKLIVGTHNYVIGSLPWSMKTGASMVGLGGNKEKGLQYLRECSESGGEQAADAKILLVLFLRREHRYEEALGMARALSGEYPHNILLALEVGNLLRAEGKNQEAAAIYRKVWQDGSQGHYAGLHYEIAALSLGDLLSSQKDFSGASTAYEQVVQVGAADPEALQKADLGAGQVYDALHQREQAVKKYQAAIAVDGKTAQAEAARKCLSAPCGGG